MVAASKISIANQVMTKSIKSTVFGPSVTFDPSVHVPRAGKSALMGQLVTEFASKTTSMFEGIFANCSTSIPFRFNPKDCDQSMILMPSHSGMTLNNALQRKLLERGGEIRMFDKGYTFESQKS